MVSGSTATKICTRHIFEKTVIKQDIQYQKELRIIRSITTTASTVYAPDSRLGSSKIGTTTYEQWNNRVSRLSLSCDYDQMYVGDITFGIKVIVTILICCINTIYVFAHYFPFSIRPFLGSLRSRTRRRRERELHYSGFPFPSSLLLFKM